uniref:Transcription initiation factor TFIID subunit 8 n=1 Tax=Strigamia maritima TaxID=126957 RepID=T1IK22_STRMM
MASELQFSSARRRILFTAVSALVSEVGFEVSERAALETLTEMLQSCLFEIGRSSKALCELAGRTDVLVGDVSLALVDMGLNVEAIPAYAKRINRISLPPVGLAAQLLTPKILQAGQKKSHPPHIPEHLPAFPDPHAYIRTATYKQPVTEYEAIREKAANQKRDVERALTRFIAKTGETDTLFADENNLFPLIESKSIPNVYLEALLPKDQIFDIEDLMKQDPVAVPKKADPVEGDGLVETNQRKDEVDSDAIDNPYLRPIKMPRKRRH